jgi:quercetin dioxygenase-like cupin family protein
MTTSAVARAAAPEDTINLFGDLYNVLLDKDDTNGAIGLIHCVIQPGGGPPPHLNPREDLTWYILENELTFHLGADTRRVAAGESLFIPRDTSDHHTFHNDTSEPVVALFLVTPGGFEGFLREAGVPVDAPAPEPTPEALARMIELGKRYGMDMQAP